MENTNIVIETSKLSFIKDVLDKNDEEKKNIKQTKIKSDCAILKKAFEDLINNDLPNGVNQIIKHKRIKGKLFSLQYISLNSEIKDECKINTEKISKQIQYLTGKSNNIKLVSEFKYDYNSHNDFSLIMDF